MTDADLARVAYEAYRKTAGGPPFHQLTPEQRIGWHDVIDAVGANIDPGHCEKCECSD